MPSKPVIPKSYDLEIDLETDVCNHAEKHLGVYNVKLAVQGERGWPDRMFVIPGGKPFFIEFKNVDGALSKQQVTIIRRLRYYGYDVEVHSTFEQAVASIKTRMDAARISKARRKVSP